MRDWGIVPNVFCTHAVTTEHVIYCKQAETYKIREIKRKKLNIPFSVAVMREKKETDTFISDS